MSALQSFNQRFLDQMNRKIDSEIDSPEWHGKALEETKNRVTSGDEQITDCESAKQELRKRFE